MAPSVRTPLLARPLPHQSPSTHGRIRSAGPVLKRTRSPDPSVDGRAKRAKASASVQPATAPAGTRDERQQEKEERRAQREAQKEEFRVKYRKAFPSWVFHFDADITNETTLARLTRDIEFFGARVDDFFSANVTHLITDASVPPPASSMPSAAEGKENSQKARPGLSRTASLMKSPYSSKTRAVEEEPFTAANTVLGKAQEFGIKIWSVSKLDSVLERCFTHAERPEPQYPVDPVPSASATRTLTSLLAQEKVHGTTERDPSQRRHDFRYFGKGTYFVLVEDIKQELATIAAAEYPRAGKDGRERRTWPQLFCHPHARGPFVEFDERERRRWERQERAAAQRAEDEERAERRRLSMAQARSRAQAEAHAKKQGDLRRSVSMVNLQRQASGPDSVFREALADDAADADESAYASGFLASGAYVAASGNSLSVTSTTGTTSAADFAMRQLPPNLRQKAQHEVLIKRKPGVTADFEPGAASSSVMGPPVDIPERRRAMLRKARSTNTLKLPPPKAEAPRPGYCESCRQKFSDFASHIKSSRHRKFAANDANFVGLDAVLSRVRRRTLAETAAAQDAYEVQMASQLHDARGDGMDSDVPELGSDAPQLLDAFAEAEDEALYANALS